MTLHLNKRWIACVTNPSSRELLLFVYENGEVQTL